MKVPLSSIETGPSSTEIALLSTETAPAFMETVPASTETAPLSTEIAITATKIDHILQKQLHTGLRSTETAPFSIPETELSWY